MRWKVHSEFGRLGRRPLTKQLGRLIVALVVGVITHGAVAAAGTVPAAMKPGGDGPCLQPGFFRRRLCRRSRLIRTC